MFPRLDRVDPTVFPEFSRRLRSFVRSTPLLDDVIWSRRARAFHREYLGRRENYHTLGGEPTLTPESAEAELRSRLAARGYRPTPRKWGGIHTFAFIPKVSWHTTLYESLARMGPVTAYDYISMGVTPDDLAGGSAKTIRARDKVNAGVVSAFEKANESNPVDWIFVYATGSEIRAGVIAELQRRFGVPCVIMCLDDKNSWAGPMLDDHRGGQIDLAPVFDLSWASASVACPWYKAEGGNPIYMPEGCDPRHYRPMDLPKDIPISFVGAVYNRRAQVVRLLRRHGVPIQVFGPGWGTSVPSDEEKIGIFNRSVLNLGLGWAGWSDQITNVKGRDFELPCVGGGAYLTTYNSDFARHFDVGQEVLCYGNDFELVEMIRHYLARPDVCAAIGRAARARCIQEHTWEHRFAQIGRMAGFLADGQVPGSMT